MQLYSVFLQKSPLLCPYWEKGLLDNAPFTIPTYLKCATAPSLQRKQTIASSPGTWRQDTDSLSELAPKSCRAMRL